MPGGSPDGHERIINSPALWVEFTIEGQPQYLNNRPSPTAGPHRDAEEPDRKCHHPPVEPRRGRQTFHA
jgi:hypothetical protein